MPRPDVSAEACRERLKRKGEHGRSLREAGDSVSRAGSSLFWFGVSVLVVVFIIIPAVFH